MHNSRFCLPPPRKKFLEESQQASIERIEKEKMKLTEQVKSLLDEKYKSKKQLKDVQKHNGNEKTIDN